MKNSRFITRIPALFLLGTLHAQPLLQQPEELPSPSPAPQISFEGIGSSIPADIPEDVMEKVDPSVVSIQHEKAGGTGFIISEDGYILTNGHVVMGDDPELPTEPAKRITIILNDDRKYSARVLGFSMDPDVSLLKIEASTPLKPVEFADSRNAVVGQSCFAVGTPVGLKRTFTSGILSNVRRTDLNTETVVFQTDAAINRGNSGGPLFDREGRVLGVNTYASQGQNNLGFTIPIHVALDMVEDLKTRGRFVRTWVPLFFTGELYDELRRVLQVEDGILITYVMEDSAAVDMGLRPGDILVEVDGEAVSARNHADLLDFEWSQTIRNAGEETTLNVLRGPPDEREEVVLNGMLEEMPRIPAFNRHLGELVEHRYASLGLGVEAYTDLHHIIHQIPKAAQGVFVKTVMEASVASRAEIQVGDVLHHIGKHPIANVREFREVFDRELSRGETAIPLYLTRNKVEFITAIAPDYLMRNRKVVLIAGTKYNPDFDLIRRELLAKGADLLIATPEGKSVPLNGEDDLLEADLSFSEIEEVEADILLFIGGENSKVFWENELLLALVRSALDNEQQILACIGESALLPVLATEEKLEPRITLPRELSGLAAQRGANYSGKEVESDKKLVTTTGTERSIIREFLQTVANLR
jgi:serine protease Do